jgi:RNA-directed DNA polymerase
MDGSTIRLEDAVVSRLKPVLLSRRTQKHPQRCPEDRAVLKTLTARLAHILPSSSACTHLRGHGGLKAICT